MAGEILFMKRAVDIVVAAAMALLVTPLAVLIAAVLAVTGEREVFYRQTRIGRHGRPFMLLKFVTMVRNSARMGTGTLTVPNDPRVLPVGRFLRKTKLNELPQLWNVVRGDMSLVGPRPLAPGDFECYSEAVRSEIITVKPGLTGVGSIVFRNEEEILAASQLSPLNCYREEIAPRKGKLEVWYVRNQGLFLDLKLLLLTVVVVIAPGSRLHEKFLGFPSHAAP